MGYWEDEKKGEKVLIGDEPLDLLQDAFQQIAETYESDVGRKPTLSELEVLIQMALDIPEGVLSDMDDYLIHECKLKKKKKPKKISWKPGDVFAIPLNDGEVFGYGMVVKGRNKMEDLYIEYYRMFTDRELSIMEFKKAEKPYLFTADSGVSEILSGRWKKIGTIPFDENDYELPDFYGWDYKFLSKEKVYYIVKGSADDPAKRIYGVSKEEAEAVKNPAGVIGAGIIEEWLYKEYLHMKRLEKSN